MENMRREWMRFVEQTKKCQQVVGELSKLYIILHEHVRQTILKCTINLSYDPTEDCRTHLTTILDLLKRINDPNDTYLRGVDSQMLTKYQEQLYELSGQVQKLLQTHTNVKDIDVQKLQGIKHVNNKEEFSLKDQLKKSQKRRLRSRSGRKTSQLTARNGDQDHQIIEKFSQYKKNFESKKDKLEKEMQGHIQKRNNQIIFSNKYLGTSLQDYFKLRAELVDLQVADQFAKKIVLEQQDQPQIKETVQVSENLENKLFPQFKIKTKFMKSQVKQNILTALVDVKMKLLEQYHLSNLKKLSQGNPDTLIALLPHKKNQSLSPSPKKRTSHTASTITLHEAPKSTPKRKPIHQASLTRYPMAAKTYRPMVYKAGWSEELEEAHRKTIALRLFQGRMPNPQGH